MILQVNQHHSTTKPWKVGKLGGGGLFAPLSPLPFSQDHPPQNKNQANKGKLGSKQKQETGSRKQEAIKQTNKQTKKIPSTSTPPYPQLPTSARAPAAASPATRCTRSWSRCTTPRRSGRSTRSTRRRRRSAGRLAGRWVASFVKGHQKEHRTEYLGVRLQKKTWCAWLRHLFRTNQTLLWGSESESRKTFPGMVANSASRITKGNHVVFSTMPLVGIYRGMMIEGLDFPKIISRNHEVVWCNSTPTHSNHGSMFTECGSLLPV